MIIVWKDTADATLLLPVCFEETKMSKPFWTFNSINKVVYSKINYLGIRKRGMWKYVSNIKVSLVIGCFLEIIAPKIAHHCKKQPIILNKLLYLKLSSTFRLRDLFLYIVYFWIPPLLYILNWWSRLACSF